MKTDAEQNIARFIEVGKQLETFFLQRRLQLSVLKPEQLIKEVLCKFFLHVSYIKFKILNICFQDCNELKLEIARKDELIKKHYEKIAVWQSKLGDLPGSGTNGVNSNDSVTTPLQHPPQPHPPQQPMIPGAMSQPFPNR